MLFGGGQQAVAPTPMAAKPERKKTTLDASDLDFTMDDDDGMGSRKLFRPTTGVNVNG